MHIYEYILFTEKMEPFYDIPQFLKEKKEQVCKIKWTILKNILSDIYPLESNASCWIFIWPVA